MKEILTIYNEELKEIGTMSRDKIHREGLKHKVVHCWIIEKNENDLFVYFQQRAYNKSDFPGAYDIACGGHVDAGEKSQNAMIRELEEEIGLKVNVNDLTYIGQRFETLQKEEFLDDEICDIYLLKVKEETIFILGEEVEDIVKVPFNEYKKWINGELETLIAVSVIHNKDIEINDKIICPHIKYYNEELFMEMKK